MKYIISWNEADLIPLVSIIGSSVFFTIYWFLFSSEKIKHYFHIKYPADAGKIKHILTVKYAGLVVLGILPGILFFILLPHYSLRDYGLSISKGTNFISLLWIVGLGSIVATLNWFGSRREKSFSMYPQIRVKEWSAKLILVYSLAWCAYLFGYELLFRGLLLFPLADSIGIWPAIAVNVAIYSLSHIPKGMDETIGAFLLGFVLCLVTLQTETIWVAFFVHVIAALSNSLVALKFHPEMKIVKAKNSK